MDNVMLDLETMGVRPGCRVISIGAVAWEGDGALQNFHRIIDVEGQPGLRIEQKTAKWWNDQTAEARRIFTDPDITRHPLHQALADFAEWFSAHHHEALIWGNGADFDLPILAAAYGALDRQPPWKPFNGRCYRTIKNLAPQIKMKRLGTHHNALDDARSQAIHLREIIRHLGISPA